MEDHFLLVFNYALFSVFLKVQPMLLDSEKSLFQEETMLVTEKFNIQIVAFI